MEIQIFTASLHQNVVLTEYQRKSEIISCAIENERAKQRWEESAWSKTPKSGVFLANSKYSSDKRGGFTRCTLKLVSLYDLLIVEAAQGFPTPGVRL